MTAHESTEIEVLVRMPRVLAELTGCARRIPVRGSTVANALGDLVRRHPELGFHLFDDTGSLRRHVLCFRNEVAIDNRAEEGEALAPGDELTIMNSVAGG